MGGIEQQSALKALNDGLSKMRLKEMYRSASLATTVKMAKEKITLQTLPLEIKHEIFSYLLLSTKVKHPCPTVGARREKYAFQTEILRVNKQLSAEATSYLYTYNNFAVVIHKYVGFDTVITDGCVPTVTSPLKTPFLYPALFVTTKLTLGTCTCGKMECSDPTDQPRKQKLLMLMDDLPALLAMIQIMNHVFFGNNIFVLSPPEEDNIRSASHCEENTTELRLRIKNNPFLELSRKEQEARQRKLLNPFTVLQNRSQTVTITGDVIPHVAKEITQTMMPKVIWLTAVGWDLYDVICYHKHRLDQLLDDACLHWLCNVYEHVGTLACHSNALSSCQVGQEDSLANQTLPSDPVEVSKTWQFAVIVTGVDCLVTAAALAMKCGNRPMCFSIASMAINAVKLDEYIQQAFPPALMALALHFKAISGLGRPDPETPNRVHGALHDALRLVPGDEDLIHDLDLVNKIRTGDFGDECMVPKITLRPLECKTEMPNLARPDGLKGWINTKHRLTPGAMRMLKKRAEKHKVKVLAEREVRARQEEQMREAMEAMQQVFMSGIMGVDSEDWEDESEEEEEESDDADEDALSIPELEALD